MVGINFHTYPMLRLKGGLNLANYNSDNIGYLLNKASRSMKWQLNNRLEHYGLTAAQFAVLKDLQMNESIGSVQSATPAAIAERLNMDRPTMSGIVNRMTKNEWIAAGANPEDKRSQLIKLTDKAREILGSIEDVSNELLVTALKGFADSEITEIKGLLKKIIDNLD
jgi:MarR family transcriptional regulator for hemolysin